MGKSSELKKIYFDWLFNEYIYEDLKSNIVKIDTPFIDNQLDTIVMYAEFLNHEKIRLTDDGWTINNLESRGLTYKKRNALLEDITNSLGIEIINNELTVTAPIDKLPIVKQRLLQAIMRANDLIVLREK